MIYSETIEIVHSSLIDWGVSSVEDEDYRTLSETIRLTEDEKAVKLEDGTIRIIE